MTGGRAPGTSGYVDSCPVHLLSAESLRELSYGITVRRGQQEPMGRFRSSIVIHGWTPHEEDRALRITVRGAVLT